MKPHKYNPIMHLFEFKCLKSDNFNIANPTRVDIIFE